MGLKLFSSTYKLALTVALFLTLSAFDTTAQCVEQNFAFKAGENLTYRGYYNWGFIWVAAGEVNLKVEDSSYENKDAFKITGLGKNVKAFDWFFKLRDTLTCYVDKDSLKPLYFDRRTNEAKYNAHHEYWFNYEKNEIYSKIRKKTKPVKRDTIQNKPCTFQIHQIFHYFSSSLSQNRKFIC